MPTATDTSRFAMPVLLSSASLLNAAVKGAERAAAELGEGHYAIVRGDFLKNILAVYRAAERPEFDAFDTAQGLVEADRPIWSTEFSSNTLSRSGKIEDPIFKAVAPRYFFLTRGEALEYLASIEQITVELIHKSATEEEAEAAQ